MSTRVFVGNLPDDVIERTLDEKFSRFGRVVMINVKFPWRPPPFAFIEYEKARDADDAVRDMNGRMLDGSRLRVEISHATDESERSASVSTPYRVVISGLPSDMSREDLKIFLRSSGDVVHTEVDRHGGGTACFASFDDMELAIKDLDDTTFKGERIRLREEHTSGNLGLQGDGQPSRRRRARSRSRSRSHSRSRSRSRSKSRSRSPRCRNSRQRRSRS